MRTAAFRDLGVIPVMGEFSVKELDFKTFLRALRVLGVIGFVKDIGLVDANGREGRKAMRASRLMID